MLTSSPAGNTIAEFFFLLHLLLHILSLHLLLLLNALLLPPSPLLHPASGLQSNALLCLFQPSLHLWATYIDKHFW